MVDNCLSHRNFTLLVPNFVHEQDAKSLSFKKYSQQTKQDKTRLESTDSILWIHGCVCVLLKCRVNIICFDKNLDWSNRQSLQVNNFEQDSFNTDKQILVQVTVKKKSHTDKAKTMLSYLYLVTM